MITPILGDIVVYIEPDGYVRPAIVSGVKRSPSRDWAQTVHGPKPEDYLLDLHVLVPPERQRVANRMTISTVSSIRHETSIKFTPEPIEVTSEPVASPAARGCWTYRCGRP